MATITIDDRILAHISQIAGNYQAYIGFNPQTVEITAREFSDAGKLALFKNDVETFLNTLKLRSFCLKTRYNPYEVDIRWRE